MRTTRVVAEAREINSFDGHFVFQGLLALHAYRREKYSPADEADFSYVL